MPRIFITLLLSLALTACAPAAADNADAARNDDAAPSCYLYDGHGTTATPISCDDLFCAGKTGCSAPFGHPWIVYGAPPPLAPPPPTNSPASQ